jgi:hypothetical protein
VRLDPARDRRLSVWEQLEVRALDLRPGPVRRLDRDDAISHGPDIQCHRRLVEGIATSQDALGRAQQAQALLVGQMLRLIHLFGVLGTDALGGQPHAIAKLHHGVNCWCWSFNASVADGSQELQGGELKRVPSLNCVLRAPR